MKNREQIKELIAEIEKELEDKDKDINISRSYAEVQEVAFLVGKAIGLYFAISEGAE